MRYRNRNHRDAQQEVAVEEEDTAILKGPTTTRTRKMMMIKSSMNTSSFKLEKHHIQ